MGERIGRINNDIQLLLIRFCRSVCSLWFLRLSRQKQVEIRPFHTSVDEILLLDSFDRYSLWLYFNRKKNTLAICMVLPLLLREEQPDTYFFPINNHAIIMQSYCIRLSLNENKDLPESSTKERRKTGWFGVISRSLVC